MSNTTKPKDAAHQDRIRLREAGELNSPRRYLVVRADEHDEQLGHAGSNERWLKLWPKINR